MSDIYLRSKFLARLSQHQSLLKTKINPEKYWGFITHLKDHFKITGLDVELREMINPLGQKLFRINLEIYFEKTLVDYKLMRQLFQLYFYEPHDVRYGQDFLFVTMKEEPIYYLSNQDPFPYYPSFQVHNALNTSQHF